jgi:hypothetical protein
MYPHVDVLQPYRRWKALRAEEWSTCEDGVGRRNVKEISHGSWQKEKY